MDTTLERIYHDEEIRDEIRAALAIVAEIEPPENLTALVFQTAMQMRSMRKQPAGTPVALPMMAPAIRPRR